MKICKINSCERSGKITRGLCRKHYIRYLRHGTPQKTLLLQSDDNKSMEENLYARTKLLPSGCIVHRKQQKYWQITFNKKLWLAHRLSFVLFFKKKIPKKMQLDHLCRTPSCINPTHLEIVSPKENTLRGFGPAALNAKKRKCPNNHLYTGKNNRGQKICTICIKERRKS